MVYIDDISVTGTTEKVPLNTLNEVLSRPKKAGVNAAYCVDVAYTAHTFTSKSSVFPYV